MPEGGQATVLTTTGLTKRFGGVVALDRLDLDVAEGEVLGVIGPNGAGKSTLIGLLSGAHRVSGGVIQALGADVTHWPPDQRARLGIARTYQVPQPFARLSVLENVLVALRHAGRRGREREPERQAHAILERTGLAEFAEQPAGDLPLIRLKRLEVARALALSPRLLLLDEVGAGLVPKELEELIELVASLRGEVAGILIVEHVMDVITSLCDRVLVLDGGRKIVEGPPRAVLEHPEVLSAYLGRGREVPVSPVSADDPGERQEPKELLRLTGVRAGYGKFQALQDVSLSVGEGEIVALLGANGAGKTTTARVISGLLSPWAGRVEFQGQDLGELSPHGVVRAGIAHCMEGRRIFSSLSVEENLVLALRRRQDEGRRAELLDEVYQLFPVLKEKRRHSGGALSGGEQQMLAIGRALMSEPRLIIFDEISLGLAPIVVDRLYEALVEVNRQGVAMIVIEQNVERGLKLARRAYVLEKGRVVLAGACEDVRLHPELMRLYVGGVESPAS